MPTCPGCKQRVSHDRLDTHLRYCHGLRTVSGNEQRAIERLEGRVETLDRQFRALQTAVRNTSPAEDDGELTVLEHDR